MKNNLLPFTLFCLCTNLLIAATPIRKYQVKSPDDNMPLPIVISENIRWSMDFKNEPIILSSAVSMKLQNGEILGGSAKVTSTENKTFDTRFNIINYFRPVIQD